MTHSITIGFSSPLKPGIFSRLIRLSENIFMRSNVQYSHVYVQFKWDVIDRVVVFQTNRHGAHFIEHSHFLEHNRVVKEYVLEVDTAAFKSAIQACIDSAAKSYGFKEIVGIALIRCYNKWFNKKASNPLGDGNTTYVCSALTAKVLEVAGFDVFNAYDWEYYGPVQVEKLLAELLKKELP